MPGSFHSRVDIDGLPDEARAAFVVALRLAAEKGGRAWITEGGEVVAQLVLTSVMADEAAERAGASLR
jgi:hypothetical protein